MEFNCYRCGQPGHTRSECPTAHSFPPAPPAESREPEITYTPPPYHAPVFAPSPPTEDYLAAKAAIGMPYAPNLHRVLSVICPWCGSGVRVYCRNPGTGRNTERPHEARYAAVLAPLPDGIAGADLAVEQLAETRAARSI